MYILVMMIFVRGLSRLVTYISIKEAVEMIDCPHRPEFFVINNQDINFFFSTTNPLMPGRRTFLRHEESFTLHMLLN